jgi:hypothetical protein
MGNGRKEMPMMAPKLSLVDTEPLEVFVNKATQERESNLSPLTTPQKEFTGVTMKHLTLPSRTVLIKKADAPKVEITEPLSIHALSVDDASDNSRTTEPLPDPDKPWMSVLQQRIYLSLIFFAIGFSAITALAIAIIGWLPLDTATYIFIWPSLITWLVIGLLYPDYGKLALRGFLIGILACFFYDCMRFTTIALGLWGDFIPRIGMWLFHTNKPDWVVGYIWRYVGDGGFMSVAFVVGYHLLKPKLDVRIAALAFGIAIWLCLVGTTLLAPHGTEMLFPLTPITFSLSLLGHIIYGLSIGFLYPVLVPNSKHLTGINKPFRTSLSS